MLKPNHSLTSTETTTTNFWTARRVGALLLVGGVASMGASCFKSTKNNNPTYTSTTAAELEAKAATKHCPDGDYVQLIAKVTPKDDPKDKYHHFYAIATAPHMVVREAISHPSHPAMEAGSYSVSGQVHSVGGGHYACVIDEVGMAKQ
jgi:hypothetical protein